MNRVYILNENDPIKGFNSILMNDLNERNIRFSNVHTTRMIDYDNILIYIPTVGFYLEDPADQVARLDNVYNFLQYFHTKIVITDSSDNYHAVRPIVSGYIGKKNFRYYQTIGFDTTISRIVTNNCLRILSNFNKFHSK